MVSSPYGGKKSRQLWDCCAVLELTCKVTGAFCLTLFKSCFRSATSCATDNCTSDSTWGDHWQGSIWRSLVWPLERGKCCSQDLFLSRRTILVPRSWDLPDSDVETWKYPGLHCCWQQRFVPFYFYSEIWRLTRLQQKGRNAICLRKFGSY